MYQNPDPLMQLQWGITGEMNKSSPKPESFDVFLCHNSEDKPEIRRIADDLIKQGIKPWLDEREIKPGDFMANQPLKNKWLHKICNGLRR